MELYEKSGNILYILNVLKKYTDEKHKLSVSELKNKIKEEYNVSIEPRTIRRDINLLKEKFGYDISTYNDNNIGYYISNDPETDFEPGEIRAIIDMFSYSTFIEKSLAKGIIKKCKNLQNIYENEKIKNYKVYSPKAKTTNMEVIKNIEDISNSIKNNHKIKFDYWKYAIIGTKIEKQNKGSHIVSPYAIFYEKQQLYMMAIKDGKNNFVNYRLDRIRNLEETSEPITIKKSEKDIEHFANTTVEAFSGDEVEIEAICKESFIEEVLEKFGNMVEITPINPQNFKMKLCVNPMGFKLWATRNLDMVTVTKPQNLVEEIKNNIDEAARRYNT